MNTDRTERGGTGAGWATTSIALLALLATGAACGDGQECDENAPSVNTPKAAPEEPRRASGGLIEDAAFVGTAACAECHADEHAAWLGSHHDLAMQEATEATVLGDFDDAVFEHRGVTTRFFRKDAGFYVETEGPDGLPREFEVTHVIGVEPLQQVIVPFEHGGMHCLTVAWDVANGEWYSLHPEERRTHDDAMHWSGVYNNWNSMCAECHVTEFAKNYDEETGTYASTWVALDVSCEACHGAGAEHVAWARDYDGEVLDPDADVGLPIDLRRGDSVAQINACAPCHSLRSRTELTPPHGADFLSGHRPSLLVPESYHADGQILGEVYVYGSFAQSKMHARGVACTDCHEPHSLGLLAPGNAVCTQCHSPYAPLDRFPTLKAQEYSGYGHHRHPGDGPGTQCVDCHMPERTYMGVDPRRDHSMRVPRPDLSVRTGTPNACTGCHTDRDDAWAAEAVEAWYGEPEDPHFGDAFALARRGDPRAIDGLHAILANEEQAPLVRATAIELIAGFGAMIDIQPFVTPSLQDPSPIIRGAAAAAFERVAPESRVPHLLPLLRDEVAFVRIAAARALSEVRADRLPEESATLFLDAIAELEASLTLSAERPESHLERALLAERQGDGERAVGAYRGALAIDARFLPARFNLANLLNRMGRNDEAVAVLREGAAIHPDEGEIHYSLGLALAEESGAAAAADALQTAAQLLSDRPRVRYNAGLALQAADRETEAEQQLLAAHALDARDADVVLVLAQLYLARKDWVQARVFVDRLATLAPGAPIVEELRAQVTAGEGG